MNKKQLLPAFLMLLTSVSGAQAQGKSGIDLKNFNRSVRPADDFYEFATGGWQKNRCPQLNRAMAASTCCRTM